MQQTADFVHEREGAPFDGISGADHTGRHARRGAASDCRVSLGGLSLRGSLREWLRFTWAMAEVSLGGLLSSTFLNLVVVPVLFARWGKEEAAVALPDPA